MNNLSINIFNQKLVVNEVLKTYVLVSTYWLLFLHPKAKILYFCHDNQLATTGITQYIFFPITHFCFIFFSSEFYNAHLIYLT